jgi:hypothetical protein
LAFEVNLEAHMSGDIPDLERPCSHCNGTGKDPTAKPNQHGRVRDCYHCGGSETELTEAGDKLWDFLDKHFRKLAAANIREIRIDV